MCRLEDHYQSAGHPDFVDYLRFSDDVEAIFAEPHLERAPEREPRRFRVPDETQTNETAPDQLPVLDACLQRIAKRVLRSLAFSSLYRYDTTRYDTVAPPGFCNGGGGSEVRVGSVEYEVPQKLTHLLQCIGNM